jgi:hypothetical protein
MPTQGAWVSQSRSAASRSTSPPRPSSTRRSPRCSTYQPLDSDLTAIAALASAADKVAYATGAGTWSLTPLTTAGRALIDDADAAAQRVTLGVPAVTYSATIPASPTDGDTWIYPADATNGIMWTFRYRAGSASTYKWEFIGGSPLAVTVDTEDSVTSATYAALTNAQTLTIPFAGDWNIELSAHMRPSIDNNNVVKTGWWSYDVGATGAVDADAIHWRFALNNNGGVTDFGANMHRRRRKNAIAATTVLTTKARASAASTFVGDRMIAATPIRVG